MISGVVVLKFLLTLTLSYFSVERKKRTREGVQKRKEKKLRERLVRSSYSISKVSSDLRQIT